MLPQIFDWKNPIVLKRKTKKKVKHLSSLLQRVSTLLNEGYTLTEAIDMLLVHHVENVEEWREIFNEKLRKGSKVDELFQLFPIPQNYLIMIKIADEIGTLSLTLSNIATQMNFQEKMKNKLRKLLMYPFILLVFIMCLFAAFRIYFFPNLEQILASRGELVSNMPYTKFFLYIPDFLIIFTFILSIVIGVSYHLLRKKAVNRKIDILCKIPIVNYFFRLQLTKVFAKSLGDLLEGGFSLQQALMILKEQKLNDYMSYIAGQIEHRIIFGEPLSKAVKLTDLFFKKFDEYIEHGENSGYLGRELLLYYELLEEKFQNIIKNALSVVQPVFFVLIALCIVAAYLSILLPMYNLIEIV